MSWQRAWALAVSTQNHSSNMVLMMSPRNSFTWLSSRDNFSQLITHLRLVSMESMVVQAWSASSLLDTITMMLSM